MNFAKVKMTPASMLPYGIQRKIYVRMGDVVATAQYFPPTVSRSYQVEVWDFAGDAMIQDVTGKIDGWCETYENSLPHVVKEKEKA